MTLILDSGGLLAALDPGQNDHETFSDALTDPARGPLVISPFVVAELDYMILRDYGREGQVAFLQEVDRGAYRLESFDEPDFSQAFELVSQYHHLASFGIADASNVVLAERHSTADILTTDQRDFRRVQLPDGGYFRILPYDL
ncbi:MAG: PIN domain-containing protein [Rubrobacteraceae bacterium]